MNLFKNIIGRNIEQKFSWINEPLNWIFKDNRLIIQAQASSDFFIDEEGPSFRHSAPFLYTYAKSDFELTTKVDVDMRYNYDSGCIMIMLDMKNWAKLCYEYWLNEPSIVSVVTKTISDDCLSLKIGKVKPYLKVLRSGNCFGFHQSFIRR
jgi:regulation of enolase protein 1 (concanavalin A-like superfamily)